MEYILPDSKVLKAVGIEMKTKDVDLNECYISGNTSNRYPFKAYAVIP